MAGDVAGGPAVLPAVLGAQRARDAQAVTLVVEGAIVRVQMGEPGKAVLGSVERLLAGLAT